MIFKRKIKDSSQDSRTDKIAGRLANYLVRLQKAFADFMQRRTSGLSPKAMRLRLIIFSAVSSGLSIYFIVFAIVGTQRTIIKINRIQTPNYFVNDSLSDNSDVAVSKKEVEQLQTFQFYMDSLLNSSTGKQKYDSIMDVRPGLLDSVRLLNKLYNESIK